jgi:hypothetical protein
MFVFAITKLLSGQVIECQSLLNSAYSASQSLSSSSMDSSFNMSERPFVLRDLEVGYIF